MTETPETPEISPPPPQTTTSTSGLTPAGILGYAKGIAVTVGAILVVVVEQLPDDVTWKRWVQLALLICTVIATVSVPNAVQPVVVTAVPDA